MSNYWSRALRQRVTRRRALAGAAGGSAAALLLAACGSDDAPAVTPTGPATGPTGVTGPTGATGATGPTGPAATGAPSGLVTPAVDTSSEARRGGTLVRNGLTEPPHLDAIAGAFVALSQIAPWTYGRLLELEPGYLGRADGSTIPGIAESWEWSGDGTELVLKLRPDVKFHPIAPVNGRTLDVDDVLFSWERCVEVGQLGNEVTSVNPNGTILDMTAPDDSTLVIRLTEPVVFLLSLLAGPNSGRLQIQPKEADGGYDPRQSIIGTGPFYMSDYTPSVGFKFLAHPEYWDSQHPYVEAIDYPTIQEYSTGLSQFKAGALDTFIVRAEDVLLMKNEAPSTDIYMGDIVVNTIQLQFGYLPDSPFHDERVRQAASMSFDRDLWIDVVFNTDELRNAGLPVETAWNSAMPADIYEGWWLDPQSSAFGENSRYFVHDIAEAKALLSAAGYPDGLTAVSNHFTSTQFGADFPNLIEIGEGMLSDAGFRFDKNIYVYEQEHQDGFRDSQGRYDGISYRLGPSALSPDPVARLMYNFNVAGAGFYGFDVNGVGDQSGDPYLEDLTRQARGEMDEDARREMIFDAQRYLGGKQYTLRWPGGASQMRMAQNRLKNFNVFRTVIENKYFWLDQ